MNLINCVATSQLDCENPDYKIIFIGGVAQIKRWNVIMRYLSWGLKRQVRIKVKHGIIYDDIYTTGHNSLFVRSFTAFKSQLNILTLGCYPLSTSKAGFAYFWPKIKVHFPNYFTALLGLKNLRRQRQERMISLRNRAFAEEHKKCNTELCSLKRIERTQLHTAASTQLQAHSCNRLQDVEI